MEQTVGVGIIVRNGEGTIKDCIESFIDEVDQCVVVFAGESTDKTVEIVKSFGDKVETYDFKWVDDFSAARNFSFSKLKTDWFFWCDADDVIHNAPALRKLANEAQPPIGAIWFPYHYATDEFGNPTTIYERERLLRASYGWIWKSRLHETVSPLQECKYVRSDEVILLHRHGAGGSRGERNFGLLNIMYKENPEDKRVWLYLGHQHFAGADWLEASKWYLKFGTDTGALPLERYQALCYCSKAMREMHDPQAASVAMMAMEIFPQYRDAYLEMAHSYAMIGDFEKALHWTFIADVKEYIHSPPAIIFLNPLDDTFNKHVLRAEIYSKQGKIDEAISELQEAYKTRPHKDIETHIRMLQSERVKRQISDGIKALAVHLLDNQELSKLIHLKEVCPYWFRDTSDYQELRAGIDHYTKEIKDEKVIQVIHEGEQESVLVDITKVVNPKELLDEMDKKYDKIKIVAPMSVSDKKQNDIFSQSDVEELITSSPNRHIINLIRNEQGIICEYDKKLPQGLHIRMFVGQGLEFWNPKTIKEKGCGGSETAAAWLCRSLARKDCLPFLYAMDNQVWDGVVYRPFPTFNPQSIDCDLFISSRVPDIYNNKIKATQKYLWLHDVHCGYRLTPEVTNELDAILVQSKWHANFVQDTYPFLKDCEVLDFDNNPLTFDDRCATVKFFENETCSKLPKIAIIGNGIDTSRFEKITEKRIPHRFIYCSSPDRGLMQLLEMWSKIREVWSDAELKIFYGWDYFDQVALGVPGLREYKEKIRQLIKQDGIEWCGRIGQEQLAKELMCADIMLYPPPHDFRETYGIAFLEAQAAGCLCVYRKSGGLGETIGRRGIPLELNATQDDIIKAIVMSTSCDIMRIEGRDYAMSRDWDTQANKLLGLFTRLQQGDK